MCVYMCVCMRARPLKVPRIYGPVPFRCIKPRATRTAVAAAPPESLLARVPLYSYPAERITPDEHFPIPTVYTLPERNDE